jgi:NAD(P)-dependent dehydrogenase (short-subunit alcohol dehydrogenase family)
MLLKGKKLVVIGGSSGIGLAIARQARAEGASLVIVGRDAGKVSNATSMLGGDAQGLVGDAYDHSALEELVAALPEFDHLVSMVGDTMAGGFLQTPLDTMRHVLHSKFWTNLLIARFAAPLIRDGGSMTFTSGSGVRAQEAAASYVANLALAAMAQGLGSELGPPRACECRHPGVYGHVLVAHEAPRGHRRQDTLLFPDQSLGASRDAGRSRIGLHLPNGQYLHDRPGLADRRRYDATEIAVVA